MKMGSLMSYRRLRPNARTSNFGISIAIRTILPCARNVQCSRTNFFVEDLFIPKSRPNNSLMLRLLSRTTMEYEAISKHVLTPPVNTASLMELMTYVRTTSDITLKKAEFKLMDVIDHIALLSDYWLFTKSEMDNNNVVFQWYHKIPKIFEDNRLMMEAKTLEFQNALKGRRSVSDGDGC